jgi:hypothetical protein
MTIFKQPARILLVMIIFSLTSCTSIPIEQVNQRIKAWETSSLKEIIKYWGVPTKTSKVNEINYAEWVNTMKQQSNSSISIGSGTRIGDGAVGIGVNLFELGSSKDQCSRVVSYTQNGKILGISWQGTQDFCYELTPDRAKILANQAKTVDQK